MSLDWEISKCEDWLDLKSEAQWPITQAILFETMSVGMGEITEKNWKAFYTRSLLIRRLLQIDPLSPSDIKRRVGLYTNVSFQSTAKWLARVYKEAEHRAKLQVGDTEEKV